MNTQNYIDKNEKKTGKLPNFNGGKYVKTLRNNTYKYQIMSSDRKGYIKKGEI